MVQDPWCERTDSTYRLCRARVNIKCDSFDYFSIRSIIDGYSSPHFDLVAFQFSYEKASSQLFPCLAIIPDVSYINICAELGHDVP